MKYSAVKNYTSAASTLSSAPSGRRSLAANSRKRPTAARYVFKVESDTERLSRKRVMPPASPMASAR